MIAVVSVAIVSALCPGLARAAETPIEEGMYDLFYTDGQGVATKYAEVKERVYGWDATLRLTGFSNAYLYSYTLFNDAFDNPGIWCWGFCKNPTSWGANVLGWTGPSSWLPGDANANPPYNTWVQKGLNWTLNPWDCGCNPCGGNEAGWTGTSGTHSWIGWGQSLDTFWLVATNPPMKMVEAFAHDGDPTGQCNTDNRYAYGMISAPTPEPVTLALLALGLPVGILARRRKKD